MLSLWRQFKAEDNQIKSKILYPAKVFSKNEGKVKMLWDIWEKELIHKTFKIKILKGDRKGKRIQTWIYTMESRDLEMVATRTNMNVIFKIIENTLK